MSIVVHEVLGQEGGKEGKGGLGEAVVLARKDCETGIWKMLGKRLGNVRAEERVLIDRGDEGQSGNLGERLPQSRRCVRQAVHEGAKVLEETFGTVVEGPELFGS